MQKEVIMFILLGRLNWWTSTGRLPRLEPLATSGDGNCLLHAASLYMWGLHDHNLILRTALHRLMTTGVEKEGLRRRWRYQTQLRNDEAGGLTFTEEEWEFEWGEILRIATNKPRRQPITDSLRRHSSLRFSYESLEEIHISVLAHTLRRPVVVISDRTIKDMSGQDLAPIYFSGIYLPLEVNPAACYKSPVVLAYDSSHFSPLVAMQDAAVAVATGKLPRPKYARMSSRKETVIPLVTSDGVLLPVQFVYDPKKKDVKEKWSKMEYQVGEFPDDIVRLLESYLNVRWIQLDVASLDERNSDDYDHIFPVKVPKVRFPAASILKEEQPIYQKELVEKYLKHIRVRFQEEEEVKARREAQREEEERKRMQNATVPCEGEGCEMFGRPATNNLCSVCYQKLLIAEEEEEEEQDGEGLKEEPALPSPEDELDVADLHRTTGDMHVSLPQPKSRDPPAYRLPPLDHHDRHSSQREPVSKSPDHSEVIPDRSQRLADDTSNTSRIPSSKSNQHQKSGGSASGSSAGAERTKQALTPLQTNVQVDQRVTGDTAAKSGLRSRSPDENTPKSCSPTPRKPPPRPHSKSPTSVAPPPPSKKPGAADTSSSSKGAVPSSPAKAKGATSIKPGKVTQSSTADGKTGQTAKLSSNLFSNLVPSKFRKSPQSHSTSSSRGGQYARDNILPLHLESTDPEVLSKAGVATSTTDRGGVTIINVKKECKTINCTFYGTPGGAGYCSTCYEVVKDII